MVTALTAALRSTGIYGDDSPLARRDSERRGMDTFPRGEDPKAEGAPDRQATEVAVNELTARDRLVHAHEAAHMAAGGSYIDGGASYTYQAGPDGQQYAIGGEVSIDMSPVPGDPQATITKMMAIESAALAPADPSAQDIAVAGAAARIRAQAEAQLRAQRSTPAPALLGAAASHYGRVKGGVGGKLNALA